MSRKLRILRLVLVVFLVLFFAGYFAFATFLFNPTEGSFALDISALVPRDVDFFLARSDLAKLFDRFPHLRDEAELARLDAWREFRDSPDFAAFDAQTGFQQALADLETNLAQLPGAVDVQEIFGERTSPSPATSIRVVSRKRTGSRTRARTGSGSSGNRSSRIPPCSGWNHKACRRR
jgi:hypothetical protein